MGVLTNLLSRANPIKEYIYAGLLVAGVIGSLLFIHHERAIGAARLAADIAKRDLAWQVKVNKVEQDAASKIGTLEGQLGTALMRPPANPIHVRVCGPTAQPALAVPGNQGSGTSGDAAGKSDSGVASNGAGADIGPATEELLNRLDAKIKYLQGYILTCQTAGVCAKS